METKRVTVDFAERAMISFSGDSIREQMNAIETNFEACNDILSGAEMDELDYAFQPEEIGKVAECIPILTAYVSSVHSQVESELDGPLTADFQGKVLPALTDIVIRDIKTYSTSIETYGDLDVLKNPENTYVVTREIGFESFLDVRLSMMTEDMQSPEVVRAVDIFLDLFREEYESLEKDGIRNLDDNMYHYLDYIPQWKYIASDVGDVIFVKPLVECIAGVDLITGEELDGYERGMKLVVAVVDLGGVGLAAKAGAGLGVKGVSEIVIIGTATDAISTMNADLTQMFVKDMGGSDRAATIAGIASGIATSYASYKILGNSLYNSVTEVNGINGGVLDSSTSTVQSLTAESVKKIVEKNGITIDEFSELLDPNRILTNSELDIVKKVRMEIGLPLEGTVMNKTIPQSDIYKYLYDENYSGIRGFVTVDEHSNSLVGLERVYEGNRLDYNQTNYKIGWGVDGISNSVGAPDTVYGKITYILGDADSVSIPTELASELNAPYTGRGFTGSKNIVLPELVQEQRDFINGDMLSIFSSSDGQLIQQLIFDESIGWIGL